MFVSVCTDLANADHEEAVSSLLIQYGFVRVQKNLYEHTGLNETALKRLKYDMDKNTDSYDVMRIYQYPFEGTLVITALKGKKWRKLVARA
ncbi:MAG: CRISPR-associated protein Cas2 [Spirochaetales bacterium]|nr:CRISPR-associated protein Cas2 [Spirochaetales bacterium]